eukprot:gnl/MRDRNA2_/MRDRNA2_27343_c0_seq1.p1 gnl/MRDRNA2_/MRDRNA2_27343_c0~~gnl/MRDRNA2_/MRDRNA2_27343_c0_seq1.p1  ORF type:complete len:560 (+),score=129.13 gnl/MRDRNA2_/MRDRNA2_27343_c0_seq1:117-1796(+)
MGNSSAKAARKRRSSSLRANPKDPGKSERERASSSHSSASELCAEDRAPRRSSSNEVDPPRQPQQANPGGFIGRYGSQVPQAAPTPKSSTDFIFGAGGNHRGDHGSRVSSGGSASSTPRNMNKYIIPGSVRHNQDDDTEDQPPANSSGPEAVLWRAMKSRKNLCKDLWDRLQMEVQVQEALWYSEREARGQAEASEEEVQARSLIVTAVTAADAQQLHSAISEAKQLLGGSISETLEECLLELCQTEEAYVALLSGLRALRDSDRMELETWVEAMQVIGLSQAEFDAANSALKELKKQEASALERLQAEQKIYEKLVFAMETQDIPTLRQVVAEAENAGVDATPARAALEELIGEDLHQRAQRSRQRERSPERTGQEQPPEAGAGGPSSSNSAYHGPNAQYMRGGGASSSSAPYYGHDGGTGGSTDADSGAGGADSGAGGRRSQANWQEEYDARRQEWERRREEWERERREWEARRDERRRDWEHQRQHFNEREQRNYEHSRRNTGSSSNSRFDAGAGAGPGSSSAGFGAGAGAGSGAGAGAEATANSLQISSGCSRGC